MREHDEVTHLLRLCRSVMPGVAGVVLSTPTGSVVAHEPDRVPDPWAIAREATRASAESHTSALVPGEHGLYLVVFVPQPLVEPSGLPPRPVGLPA